MAGEFRVGDLIKVEHLQDGRGWVVGSDLVELGHKGVITSVEPRPEVTVKTWIKFYGVEGTGSFGLPERWFVPCPVEELSDDEKEWYVRTRLNLSVGGLT